jgi:membrane fusion protein, multidrug efflux system
MTEQPSASSKSAWLSRTRLAWLGAGMLAVGLMAWLLAPGRSRSLAAPPGESEAIPVNTAVATRADVPVYLQGLGTVQAFYTVKVTAQVNGELARVAFTEGEHVKRGQLLAQIDPRPYQAALDLAVATRAKDRAQLANAQVDLQRYIKLAPQNLTSRQTLDTQRALVAELEAQIQADSASIESARTELGYTRISSPIDGVTGIRLIDPGNIVHSTDTTGIVVVTQLHPISVVFTLPESDLALVASALARGRVSATALSQDGKTRLDEGTVSVLDNQIDPSTGTMRLKATFPNPHDTLWPGEFVNVRVLAAQSNAVVVVPAAAINTGPDGPFAYVIRADSTVEVRPVTPGERSGDLTVVVSGLSPGMRVVTSNQFRMFAGARVSPY